MATQKKFDFTEFSKKIFTPAIGGVAGDVAMDLAQDYIPGVGNTKWGAPLMVLTLGAAAEYFADGKKGAQLKGVGSGMIGVAAAELSAQYFPGLSGNLGRYIENPLRRADRTTPYSQHISK